MDEREKAAHYRTLAEQLKAAAAQSVDLQPATRQVMLELADNYEELADLLERLT
jgi:hypothetical protein